MSEISLAEFADKIVEIMRTFAHGFGKKNSNELCKGKITMPQFIILDFLSTKNDANMSDIAKFFYLQNILRLYF